MEYLPQGHKVQATVIRREDIFEMPDQSNADGITFSTTSLANSAVDLPVATSRSKLYKNTSATND
jgi:hypothetical protein